MDYERQIDNAEHTVASLLRNIAALEKVVEVLLDHWGEDKEKARRGIQFICNHEVKKLGSDPELQKAWRQWAKLHMTGEAVEGSRLEGTNSWG